MTDHHAFYGLPPILSLASFITVWFCPSFHGFFRPFSTQQPALSLQIARESLYPHPRREGTATIRGYVLAIQGHSSALCRLAGGLLPGSYAAILFDAGLVFVFCSSSGKSLPSGNARGRTLFWACSSSFREGGRAILFLVPLLPQPSFQVEDAKYWPLVRSRSRRCASLLGIGPRFSLLIHITSLQGSGFLPPQRRELLSK